MNVFIDYVGHSDTYYSFHSLFENRLKTNLFRTFGVEWRKKGFLIARQYAPEMNGEVELIDDVYHIPMKMETEKGYYTQKAITFDTFLKMDFDVIVASSCFNEKILCDLVRQHKPNTVFIRWIGNIHEKPLGAKNVLLSTYEPMPPGVNYITYHPEHYEGYCYTPPTNHKTMNSFANNLPLYPDDLGTWTKCESSLKDFTFKMYGMNCRDGSISHLLMPQAIKDSAFIWHVKANGGGGFVARQALACGRPCIIKKHYAVIHNALAKNLFVDSVNCIDLDLGLERGMQMLREWSQPARHIEICKATAEKFARDANFAGEAEKIKKWINNLLRK